MNTELAYVNKLRKVQRPVMSMQNSKSKNDLVPWAFWKLARVEELLNGRDGFVRAAIVSVPRGTSFNSNQRLRRPIQHLIPTEVQPWSVSSLNFSKTDFFFNVNITNFENFKDKCLSHIYFM